MDAKQRKAQIRAGRREAAQRARALWSQEEFGLRILQRRQGARVQWDVPADNFVALMGLDRLRRLVVDGMEVELVTAMRLDGESWEDIGWALGVSGEAVRKRLSRPVAALEAEFASGGTARDSSDDESPGIA